MNNERILTGIAVFLGVCAAFLVGLNIAPLLGGGNSDDQTQQQTEQTQQTQESSPDEVASDTTIPATTIEVPSETTAAITETSQFAIPAPDPNRMVLELNDFQFYISGFVADQATADRIRDTTRAVYGEWGTTNIAVDPSIEPQPWAESYSNIIPAMWTTLLDGKLEISGSETVVNGRTPSENSRDDMQKLLDPANGFPPLTSNIELTELRAPTLNVSRGQDGIVYIRGELPSERLRSAIVDGVRESYGTENVVDEVVIDETTFARFALIRFAINITAFKPFETFSMGVNGGQAYGTFDNGLNFDSSSAELEPEIAEKLAGFPQVFARSRWPITITGYTDNQGTEEENNRLAEARANAVANYFIDEGLASERVIIVVKGEDDPAADNATAEGRALNRRVQFNLGDARN